MDNKNQYHEAHLFIAAIRILEHQNSSPPELQEIAELLGYSAEQTGIFSRRLEEAGIIEIVESAFGDRWGIKDHLKVENLPKEAATNQMDEALQQFKAEKSKMSQKIEAIKDKQAQKKKDLFSEIEKKLKDDLTTK